MKRNQSLNPVEIIKGKIVNSMFIVMTVLSVPLMISVIFRSKASGWLLSYTIQTALFGILLFILPFINRISRNLKASVIIVMLLIISVTGLYSLGYFATGKVYFIPTAIIAGLVLSRKAGYSIVIFFALFFTLISYFYITEKLTYSFDFNDFLKQPSVWITYGLAVLLSALGLMVIINKFEDAYKETLQSLQIKEENYRSLFEQAADGIVIVSSMGTILDVNKSLLENTGFIKTELLGQNVSMLTYPDQLEQRPSDTELRESVRSIRKGKHKDGGAIDIEMSSKMLADGRIQSLVRDISERVEGEKKLRESELKYRTLFDNASDPILIIHQKVFVDCNERALKMFGCKREDLIGKPPFMFSTDLQPDGRKFEEASGEKVNAAFKGQAQFFEWKCRRSDGELFDAEVSLNNFTLNNEQYLMAFMRDITEKKQLEKMLYQASMKAEENERERLAKDLHDGLGPLLSTSKIYLHSIKGLKKHEDEPEFMNKLEHTIDEALLGIKEISNNISPHILRNFGLIQAVKNYIQKLDTLVQTRLVCSIDQNRRYPEMLEVTVYRILIELMNNSLKYAAASMINILLEEHDNKLLLVYTDNGEGFDYKEVYKSKKGFGLLNIQSRVHSLHGRYVFRTKPGEGVKVEVELDI
jgi:PAS domain S-box-containing protein